MGGTGSKRMLPFADEDGGQKMLTSFKTAPHRVRDDVRPPHLRLRQYCVLYDYYFMSVTRSLKLSRNNCILCPLRKLLHERFKVTRISGTESINSVHITYL